MPRPPHQERVITERAELSDKLDKLVLFIDGPNNQPGKVFASLPAAERVRLARQRTYMADYLHVLDERVDAFPPS